jgi:hypothetical protein
MFGAVTARLCCSRAECPVALRRIRAILRPLCATIIAHRGPFLRQEPQICGIVYRVILLSTSLRSKQAETTKKLPQAGNRIFSRLGSFLFHTEPDEYEWSPPEAWQGIVARATTVLLGCATLWRSCDPRCPAFISGYPSRNS